MYILSTCHIVKQFIRDMKINKMCSMLYSRAVEQMNINKCRDMTMRHRKDVYVEFGLAPRKA